MDEINVAHSGNLTGCARMKDPDTHHDRNNLASLEIMAVVVIIGALLALAIFAFFRVRNRSQDNAVMGNMRNLGAAADQYFLDHGTSRATLGDLRAYYPHLVPVAGEVYPTDYTLSTPITVTNIAGSRTITYLQ